jgi:putative Mn2+ efflux pump MntP
LGVSVLFITGIINIMMPMIGKAAYQTAMAGSYSTEDYVMDFTFINTSAVLMIVGGIYLAYILYKNEKVNEFDSGEKG